MDSTQQLSVEEKICQCIATSKSLLERYNQLVEEGRKSNVLFLEQHMNDVYDAHYREISRFRIDLCKERGE